MGSGPEHSAPLKVKYDRLQQFTQPVILKAPTQTTRRAVSEMFLVNKHSCVIKKKKKDWSKILIIPQSCDQPKRSI